MFAAENSGIAPFRLPGLMALCMNQFCVFRCVAIGRVLAVQLGIFQRQIFAAMGALAALLGRPQEREYYVR